MMGQVVKVTSDTRDLKRLGTLQTCIVICENARRTDWSTRLHRDNLLVLSTQSSIRIAYVSASTAYVQDDVGGGGNHERHYTLMPAFVKRWSMACTCAAID